jgi:hypothetical protein
MIDLINRKNLGFEDDFEGYVFLKEGDASRPVLQLHLYKHNFDKEYFHTLFWRGHVVLEQLIKCLSDSLIEISESERASFSDLNKGLLHFSKRDGFDSVPFEVNRSFGETSQASQLFLQHGYQELFVDDSELPSFVRFDSRNKLNLPIILWADLHSGEGAEVGFSFARVDVPHPVLLLFQSTCQEHISDEERDKIRRDIWRNSKVPARV